MVRKIIAGLISSISVAIIVLVVTGIIIFVNQQKAQKSQEQQTQKSEGLTWGSPSPSNVSSNGVLVCQASLPASVGEDTGVSSDVGMVQPGSFVNGKCRIPFGGKVYDGENNKFLSGDAEWSKAKPANQIAGGVDRDNVALFVCRGEKDGVKYVGKKQDNWDFCDIPVGSEEVVSKNFEYLGY